MLGSQCLTTGSYCHSQLYYLLHSWESRQAQSVTFIQVRWFTWWMFWTRHYRAVATSIFQGKSNHLISTVRWINHAKELIARLPCMIVCDHNNALKFMASICGTRVVLPYSNSSQDKAYCNDSASVKKIVWSFRRMHITRIKILWRFILLSGVIVDEL